MFDPNRLDPSGCLRTASGKFVFMKRATVRKYVTAVFLLLGLLVVYQLVPINFFRYDLLSHVSNGRFTAFGLDPHPDEGLILLNTGQLQAEEIVQEIEYLLSVNPKIIGLNLCHLEKKQLDVFSGFESDKRVVFCSCDENGRAISAMRIESNGDVAHFYADGPQYFEIQLSGHWDRLQARDNQIERIYYIGSFDRFFHSELKGIANTTLPEGLENIAVLIGYMGDQIIEPLYPRLPYRKRQDMPCRDFPGENCMIWRYPLTLFQ